MLRIDGFILIDKPRGISSFQVIRRLRAISGERRIGHSGTLDPLASGLLVCALGKYTRLVRYLEALDKTYSSDLTLGARTTTADAEGSIVEERANIPPDLDSERLTQAVLALKELPTPAYSAVKVNGKPAYSYARAGSEISLEPRPVRIHEFEVLGYQVPVLGYRCRVSKGTYVRSLGEKIAELLGTVGYTSALRRTAVGHLNVSAAIELDSLTEPTMRQNLHPETEVFAGFSCLKPSTQICSALERGQSFPCEGPDEDPIILFGSSGKIVGVAGRNDGVLYPVVNLSPA